jgi:hypothetical protein
MFLFVIRSKKILSLFFIRNHPLIHEFKIRLHFTHVSSGIFFELEMYVNWFFLARPGNSRNPFKIGLLIAFTNPTMIYWNSLRVRLMQINGFDPVNPPHIDLISLFLLFLIQLNKTIIINQSIIINKNPKLPMKCSP